MKVDLSSTKDFTPPSDGDYLGEIIAADPGKTDSGFDKLDIRWRIEEKGVEKTVFDTVAVGGPGAFKAEQLLIAVGLCNTKEEVQGYEIEPPELIGRQARLRIKGEVYTEEQGGDGDIRGKIKRMTRVATAQARAGGLFGNR